MICFENCDYLHGDCATGLSSICQLTQLLSLHSGDLVCWQIQAKLHLLIHLPLTTTIEDLNIIK